MHLNPLCPTHFWNDPLPSWGSVSVLSSLGPAFILPPSPPSSLLPPQRGTHNILPDLLSSSLLVFFLAPVSNESNPYITMGSWQFYALCMADNCENNLWTKYIVSLSATLFVKNTHSKHKVSLYKFLCLLIFWGPNLSEYRLLKEASLIETENYPCPNNRAAVEAGNNGMSGGSFWVPESVDINFPPSLSWHFQWWELSLTWS